MPSLLLLMSLHLPQFKVAAFSRRLGRVLRFGYLERELRGELEGA